MRKPSKLAILLFFVVVVAAFGLTKLTSVLIQNSQITNSTINSTTIGGTSPSTASFTAQMAANTSVSPSQPGSYLGWNQSGGMGEMDFIDQRGNGTGGFNWYVANSANQMLWNPMTLNYSGDLYASSSVHAPNLYGTLTGNVNGNALSANTLANSPAQCGIGGGVYTIGIQANGNANCYSYPQSIGVPGYFTLPNNIVIEYGSTAITSGNGDYIALPYTLPHGIFTIVASDGGGASNPTSSSVYAASAVINPSNAQYGFYGYLKNSQGNYTPGVISWMAIGH